MRANIHFKYWMIAAMTLPVMVLTTLFLTSVFSKFSSVAEDNAKEKFSLVTQHALAEITNLVDRMSYSVSILSNSAPGTFTQNGKINQNELVSPFIGALSDDPNVYGIYFGLNNDEFLQVIGVRAERKIIESLNAPAQTYFAIRRISQDKKTREYWQFLDKEENLLQEQTKKTDYAPSERPWFVGAKKNEKQFITAPYLFSSTGEPGLTISANLPGKIGVLGTDINLSALKHFLSSIPLTPNAAILLLDERNRILAFHGRGKFSEGLDIPPLTHIDTVNHPIFKSLARQITNNDVRIIALDSTLSGNHFVVSSHLSTPLASTQYKVIAIAPMLDFTAPIERARQEVLLVSGCILILLLPLSLLGSSRVVDALARLATNSEAIKHLDFSTAPIRPVSAIYEINALSDSQQVMHHSIRERTADLSLAKEKLARLVENGILLSSERDRHKLLRHILFGSRDIAHCEACTLFLRTEKDTLSFAMRTFEDDLPPFEVPIYDPQTGKVMAGFVSSYVAQKNETVVIDDVYTETRFDLTGTKNFSEKTGFRTVSMLTVPLSPRSDEVIGVLQLMNALDPETGKVIPFPPELIRYIEALAAQAAVALENHNLLAAQKELMDSMIKILAGAIDAKSPYTGNHCKRVPELAVMLAEEASKATQGSLANFAFESDDEWREFRIGAWMHDCGKVTTPEHVIDKATKLETIYNRIHEVRSRFEIMLRDAQIARLESILAGTPETDADAAFSKCRKQLIDDYAFIAECNIGGEFMDPGRIERLQQIGRQTWLRHFDDRIGLSLEELQRRQETPPTVLPTVETLLSDKPEHIVPRTDMSPKDPKYGFRMNVPENLYNFGELHNLAIERGTLSAEERFKINEHIIQTIIMLESMPFPKSLKRVPEYAGEHHETLLGGGYPRKKTMEQLSIPSRIMAIADIFEALTASDRPYKKAKTLSESVKILSVFKKNQHIDPELFDLFLTSGVYRRYAEQYLEPNQIDEVDISQFVS